MAMNPLFYWKFRLTKKKEDCIRRLALIANPGGREGDSMPDTPPRSNWPGIGNLVNYGPEGVLYIAGFSLLMRGLFGYWPPTAANGRAMLGFAFLCWARGAHHWRGVTYLDINSPHRTRLSVPDLLWFIAWFTGGCLFFLAFYSGANPLSRFIGHP